MMAHIAASNNRMVAMMRIATPIANPPITAAEERSSFCCVDGDKFWEFERLGAIECVILAEGVAIANEWPNKEAAASGVADAMP